MSTVFEIKRPKMSEPKTSVPIMPENKLFIKIFAPLAKI